MESAGLTLVEPCGATLPTPGARFSVVALLEDQVSVTDWPRCTMAGAACNVTGGRAGGGAAGGGGGGGATTTGCRLHPAPRMTSDSRLTRTTRPINRTCILEILLESSARARA